MHYLNSNLGFAQNMSLFTNTLSYWFNCVLPRNFYKNYFRNFRSIHWRRPSIRLNLARRPWKLKKNLLLKSYIENRTFSVKISSTISDSHDTLRGVLQESDIVPFLYTLFTADISTTENTLIDTYANDTVILASNPEPLIHTRLLQTTSTCYQNGATLEKLN